MFCTGWVVFKIEQVTFSKEPDETKCAPMVEKGRILYTANGALLEVTYCILSPRFAVSNETRLSKLISSIT